MSAVVDIIVNPWVNCSSLFQYFVFDFVESPAMIFDKMITLTVSVKSQLNLTINRRNHGIVTN